MTLDHDEVVLDCDEPGSIFNSASSALMVTGPAISNGSPFSRMVKVYPNRVCADGRVP